MVFAGINNRLGGNRATLVKASAEDSPIPLLRLLITVSISLIIDDGDFDVEDFNFFSEIKNEY